MCVVLGDMAAVVILTVSAQASVQQVDMRLTQQLPVQVQRTASRARLANTVQLARQHQHALVRVLLAGIRWTAQLQDPRPPTASHVMQDDTVKREARSHSALVIVQLAGTR